MTTMMLDSRDPARVDFDLATAKSGTPADAILTQDNPSRERLVCQWHRTPEGRVICTWAQVASPLTESRPEWLSDGSRETGFAGAPETESRLQAVARWIGINTLLASAAVVTVICFMAEPSGLL
jgi:hypothetical protein